MLCCQNFYLYTISSLHLTRLEEFNTCEVNSRHQNSEHDESTKLSVRRKFWLLPTNLSGQIVTFGKNVFNCTYLVVKGVGHSVVTRLHFIAGTTNPDWWFVTILVLTSWDGRPLCLDRLYVRGIIGGQVPTSNTHQQIDFLRGCRREEGGGRWLTVMVTLYSWTVLQTSPPQDRSDWGDRRGVELPESASLAWGYQDWQWKGGGRGGWPGDQGVTNVCGGKIFLKQFPADTAQWGPSLPAIVCISIQLLASCSSTTPHQCGNNLLQPVCLSVSAGSNQELTNFPLLSPSPQLAGFTEFSVFCSLRIREAGAVGLSTGIIDDKN